MRATGLYTRRLMAAALLATLSSGTLAQAVAPPGPQPAELAASGATRDVERERGANLVKQKEDCEKPIDKIAFENLSPEQQKALGPNNALEDTAIGGAISGVKTIFSFVTKGTTPVGDAQRALNANRAAAIKFKAEFCSAGQEAAGRPPAAKGEITTTTRDGQALQLPTVVASSPAGEGMPSILKVKGLDDWEGEISGQSVPGSKFETLTIGMKATQVLASIGQPDDQRLRDTAKAMIPFYIGADKQRMECSYKGFGRLIFSSAPGTGVSEMHLISIVHDRAETGKL